MTLLLLLLLFSGVLIRKIWPKWDSAWYRLGSLLYARCVTGSTKFGALYYSLSTVSNCRFFEIPLKLSQWTTSRLLILRSLIVTLFFVCWFYAVRLQSSSSFVDSTQLDRKALFCSLILRSSVAKLLFVWGVTKSKKFGALYYPSSMGFRFQSSLRFTSISTFLWLSNVQRYLMYSLYLLYPLYPVRGTKKAGVTLKLDCLKPKITPAWLLVADRVERS